MTYDRKQNNVEILSLQQLPININGSVGWILQSSMCCMHSYSGRGATVIEFATKSPRGSASNAKKMLVFMAYKYLLMSCTLSAVNKVCAEAAYLVNSISLLRINCLGEYHPK